MIGTYRRLSSWLLSMHFAGWTGPPLQVDRQTHQQTAVEVIMVMVVIDGDCPHNGRDGEQVCVSSAMMQILLASSLQWSYLPTYLWIVAWFQHLEGGSGCWTALSCNEVRTWSIGIVVGRG